MNDGLTPQPITAHAAFTGASTGFATSTGMASSRTTAHRGSDDPWLLAFDVDGTIMHKNGHMSDAVAQALRAISAAGSHVVLSTGRSLFATLPVAEMIGQQSGWAVSSNGSIISRLDARAPGGHEVVERRTFNPEPAARLVRKELPDAIFAVENMGEGFFLTEPFPDGELSGTQTVVSFEDLVRIPATRLTVRSPQHTPADFHSLVRRLGLRDVAYSVGYVAWLDLNPEGVSKASGLENVRQRLGVNPMHTMAFGDGFNDIEMLQWAAHSVAMGDAQPEVQAAATEVTGSVVDDGIVPVVEAWLRGRR